MTFLAALMRLMRALLLKFKFIMFRLRGPGPESPKLELLGYAFGFPPALELGAPGLPPMPKLCMTGGLDDAAGGPSGR